jgi:hypothetical protein
LGEVSMALVTAASARPGTVVQLAERACVGYDVARFKASALVRSGALVALTDERPRVLAAPSAAVRNDTPACNDYGLRVLPRSFWECVERSSVDDDEEGCGMR